MCMCIVNQEEDKCWYRPCRFLSYPYLHFRRLWKCLENARVRVFSPELTCVTTCKTPCKERKIPKKKSDDSLSLVTLSKVQIIYLSLAIKRKGDEKIYIYIDDNINNNNKEASPTPKWNIKRSLISSYFLFFSRFLVLLFSINIYLNNCYLIKCNKQQEKYRVSREKIVHRILNIWINNLNFYYFLQFTVGKPELITTWSFFKQRSHEFFI